MKLLFITLTILGSYFVNARPAPVNIAPAAITSFEKTFKEASDVEWLEVGGLFRAQFTYGSEVMYAFYDEQGNQVCIGRMITIQQFPLTLRASFQNKFPEVVVLDAFEVLSGNRVTYYVTIIKNNSKIILQSVGMENWAIHSKTKN